MVVLALACGMAVVVAFGRCGNGGVGCCLVVAWVCGGGGCGGCGLLSSLWSSTRRSYNMIS